MSSPSRLSLATPTSISATVTAETNSRFERASIHATSSGDASRNFDLIVQRFLTQLGASEIPSALRVGRQSVQIFVVERRSRFEVGMELGGFVVLKSIAGVRRELGRWPWIGVAFVALGLIFVADIVGPEIVGPGQSKDFSLWYQTGRAVLEGRPIYEAFQDQHVYFLYPPFAAILLALPATLGRIGDYAALGILNWLAWMVAAVAGLALSGGPINRLTLVVPSVALLTLIAETFTIGQPNLILLAIVLLGFVAIEAKREILGGALIALAASIKAFPATLLVYLLIRRNYRAAAAMAVAILAFTFAVPVAVRGPTLAVQEISTWSRNMLTADASDLAQRGERNWGYRNQSLLAETHRLTRNVEKMPEESLADEPHINVVDLGFRGANLVFVALSAALGAGFLWMRSRWTLSDARVRAYDLAIALAGVVAISPLARNYFFVWLLFPVAVLAGDLQRRQRTLSTRAHPRAFGCYRRDLVRRGGAAAASRRLRPDARRLAHHRGAVRLRGFAKDAFFRGGG